MGTLYDIRILSRSLVIIDGGVESGRLAVEGNRITVLNFVTSGTALALLTSARNRQRHLMRIVATERLVFPAVCATVHRPPLERQKQRASLFSRLITYEYAYLCLVARRTLCLHSRQSGSLDILFLRWTRWTVARFDGSVKRDAYFAGTKRGAGHGCAKKRAGRSHVRINGGRGGASDAY